MNNYISKGYYCLEKKFRAFNPRILIEDKGLLSFTDPLNTLIV